jgi:uncharacterized protein (TIGR02118 family)
MPLVTLFLSCTGERFAPPPAAWALVHVPDAVRDPFLDDGRAPQPVMQLYFESVAALEAAAADVRGVDGAEAMQVHRFPLPEPWPRPPERYCTYLVAYEGPADNEAAWLAHYLEHHPPLMARLPGIRELEIYTPLEWRCPAHPRRVRHLQRNKVAFDSAAALAAALDSPVRAEMRADFARFPPYRGRVSHHAMTTQVLQ